MKIQLLRNNSEKNKLEKSFDTLLTLDGTLRDNCSIVNPIFIVELTVDNTIFVSCNYVYIESFKRYYFVNEVVAINSTLFQFKCHCDVLMSFRDGINECKSIAQRQETRVNLYLNDGNLKIYQVPRIQKIAFPNIFNVKEFVLTMAGKQADEVVATTESE